MPLGSPKSSNNGMAYANNHTWYQRVVCKICLMCRYVGVLSMPILEIRGQSSSSFLGFHLQILAPPDPYIDEKTLAFIIANITNLQAHPTSLPPLAIKHIYFMLTRYNSSTKLFLTPPLFTRRVQSTLHSCMLPRGETLRSW